MNDQHRAHFSKQNQPLSVFSIIKNSLEMTIHSFTYVHPFILLLFSGLSLVVFLYTHMIEPNQNKILVGIGSIIYIVLLSILSAAIFAMIINRILSHLRDMQKPTIAESISRGFNQTLSVLGVMLFIVGLTIPLFVIAIVSLTLTIPQMAKVFMALMCAAMALFVVVKLWFASFLVITDGKKPMMAIRESSQLVSNHFIRVSLLFFCALLLSFVAAQLFWALLGTLLNMMTIHEKTHQFLGLIFSIPVDGLIIQFDYIFVLNVLDDLRTRKSMIIQV
jgi:hypothetical protein